MYYFTKLNAHQSQEIANDWHYEKEYAFYDAINDLEDYEELLSEDKENYYAVLNETNELVGYMCYEIDGQTVWLGLGMKPTLTGKGLGKTFVTSIIDFIILQNLNITKIKLAVAKFNVRAYKVYLKCGFSQTKEYMQKTNGSEYPFIEMEKIL